ncbi:MAG: hypothetical protein LM556_01745 [Desulfurococcaceae archaeon]|nr:hypothetical protein [Desulfurococcaceae archaeon]
MIDALLAIILVLILATTLILVCVLLKLKRLVKAYTAIIRAREETLSVKKPRKRYVVFTAICEERVKFEELTDAVSSRFKELFSENTYYKASPQLVLFDESTQRGVYRVTHIYLDHFIAALGLVKRIGGKKCVIVPLRTTGTLKRARELTRKLKF